MSACQNDKRTMKGRFLLKWLVLGAPRHVPFRGLCPPEQPEQGTANVPPPLHAFEAVILREDQFETEGREIEAQAQADGVCLGGLHRSPLPPFGAACWSSPRGRAVPHLSRVGARGSLAVPCARFQPAWLGRLASHAQDNRLRSQN
jgi:hypothetical protein